MPVAIAAVLTTGVIATLIAWSRWPAPEPDPEPPSVVRFDYDLPEDHVLRPFQGRHIIALSPDGRHFAYDTIDGLYLRAMGELEARLIPGTEPNLTSPVFSPDGQWVAYWEGGVSQLKRIAVSGGAPVVIAADVGNPIGLSWQTDGTILFGRPEGIYSVSASGGTPELVIPADEGRDFFSPEFLPDRDSVLFTSWSPGTRLDSAQIEVESLSTGERTVLVPGGGEAHYLPTGHLVYSIPDGSLFAVAFDPDTLAVSGGPVPLVQGVTRIGAVALANYSVSDTGTLIYVNGSVGGEVRTLVWVDRGGREEPIDSPPRNYMSPRLSPDGMKVALNPRDQENDIWTWDLARETLSRLTFKPGQDQFPVWSPDGQRIVYNSRGDSGSEILAWRPADGSGAEEQLAESDGQIFPISFLPDSTGVLVYGAQSGNDDIGIVLQGEDRATPLLATAFDEGFPEISPDGRWLAYMSNESGRNEIYVRPFPDVNAGRWQVSAEGGNHPLWARNGQEIFYRNGDAMMAVAVETDPTFVVGNPEVVFEGEYATPQGGRAYDVSLDGERFLMMKDVENTSEPIQFIVVLNWLTELERLAPTE